MLVRYHLLQNHALLPISNSRGFAVQSLAENMRLNFKSSESSNAGWVIKHAESSSMLSHQTSWVVRQSRSCRAGAKSSSGSAAPVVLVKSDGAMRTESAWRGAGVAVPVFSLRSQNSVGSGDFVDLRPLIDLCAATGKEPSEAFQNLPKSSETLHSLLEPSKPSKTFKSHPKYFRTFWTRLRTFQNRSGRQPACWVSKVQSAANCLRVREPCHSSNLWFCYILSSLKV